MQTRLKLTVLALSALLAGAGWMLLADKAGEKMSAAAGEFLSALDDSQRRQATMSYDDNRRVDWHFIPKAERKGLQIKDMNPEQRQAAHGLLSSALSEVGYGKTKAIMSLEAILRELEKERRGGAVRDPERYYFTVFGQPDGQGKWGLSVEGHHLSLNFVVEADRVVSSTPAFFGANPATVQTTVEGGPAKGTRVLAKEEELGFKLFNSLNPQQRKTALIAEKAPADLRGGGEPQPPDAEPMGLAARQMNADQVKTLWSLLESYAVNMPQEVAQRRLAEVREAGIENVHFAWAGADKPGIGHYYVAQGPTFVIEFVNTQPDSLGNPANHIHCMWRDIRGDFALSQSGQE